jgi:hypothetical protein
MITFNTGRMYSTAGQRIAATEINGKIYFNDIDRGISGVITIPCKLTERDIMRAYDGREYEGVYHPIIRELSDRALSA